MVANARIEPGYDESGGAPLVQLDHTAGRDHLVLAPGQLQRHDICDSMVDQPVVTLVCASLGHRRSGRVDAQGCFPLTLDHLRDSAWVEASANGPLNTGRAKSSTTSISVIATSGSSICCGPIVNPTRCAKSRPGTAGKWWSSKRSSGLGFGCCHQDGQRQWACWS